LELVVVNVSHSLNFYNNPWLIETLARIRNAKRRRTVELFRIQPTRIVWIIISVPHLSCCPPNLVEPLNISINNLQAPVSLLNQLDAKLTNVGVEQMGIKTLMVQLAKHGPDVTAMV